MRNNIEKIVIVGGGSAGWITASMLSTHFKNTMDITLVESSDIPTVGVGEATIIHMTQFLKEMKLGEKDWMKGCNATYKEGIFFKNFYEQGKHYWHPFQIINKELTNYWLYKYYKENLSIESYFDYCYNNTVLNGNNRINIDNKVNFDEVKNIGYTYHLDATLFAQFLKKNIALKNGVKHIVDDVVAVKLKENGFVDSIATQQNGHLEADLFVDCSGFKSLLLGRMLNEEFLDYLDILPNDRAIAARVPYTDKNKEMQPYTSATALEAGWVWNIPLWNRLGTGYVYSGRHKSEDAAEQEFRQHLGEERVKDLDFHHIKMRIGKYKNTWKNNVVAIGLSAGFVEPLESTGIELAQTGADFLTLYLKTRPNDSYLSRSLYNKKMQIIYDEIVDYIELHYVLTNRDDTEYWQDLKYSDRRISDSVINNLLKYESSFSHNNSGHIFLNTAWSSILIGMRHIPTLHNLGKIDPAKYASANKYMEDSYKEVKQRSRGHVGGNHNPSHYEFLKKHIYDE